MRDVALDRVRGLAILLMVVDHVLVVADPGHWLRYTVTRAALPLFCIVAGSLLRDRVRWSRIGEITLWGGLLSLPWLSVGRAWPDVLLLLSPALVIGSLLPSGWVAVLGLVQAYTLPLPWTGYQLGYIVALVIFGRLLRDHFRSGVQYLGASVPSAVGVIGRYPLSVYVGHLVVLSLWRRWL